MLKNFTFSEGEVCILEGMINYIISNPERLYGFLDQGFNGYALESEDEIVQALKSVVEKFDESDDCTQVIKLRNNFRGIQDLGFVKASLDLTSYHQNLYRDNFWPIPKEHSAAYQISQKLQEGQNNEYQA